MCKTRCSWSIGHFDAYEKYHDEEWGVPVHNDQKHFEFLILEGAQAGLSWSTVLKKREGYKEAFSGFSPEIVSRYSETEIQEILLNPGIIRNKLKIRGAVTNAVKFLEIQQTFGSFDSYIWSFVDNTPINNTWKTTDECPATSKESDALSKDLKNRGFKFVGSTIMYAHMQACGLVNDHTLDCFRYSEILELQ